MSAPSTTRIVLVSQSPRRRRLLEWLGLPFDVAAVDTPEDLDTPLARDPEALAKALATEKAETALDEELAPGALALCFDTVVVHKGEVLGKPRDEADAWRMLRSLSGATHQVVTGVAIACPGQATLRAFSVVTDVTMKPLSDCQIEAWMAMGTFMGCAGAYNIEAQVAEVTAEECFQNVAGLPLCHLYAVLVELGATCGLPRPSCPVSACDTALGRTCGLGPRTAEC